MAEKKSEMTQEQKTLLTGKGLQPARYEVLQDYPHSMIIRERDTKEPMVIFKD